MSHMSHMARHQEGPGARTRHPEAPPPSGPYARGTAVHAPVMMSLKMIMADEGCKQRAQRAPKIKSDVTHACNGGEKGADARVLDVHKDSDVTGVNRELCSCYKSFEY